MSDMEETKPDANKLLSCKLEFETHDEEDTPDLSSCVAVDKQKADSSIEQTIMKVKPNSSIKHSTTEVKPSTDLRIEQTRTGVKRSLLLDSSDDEDFTEELLCSASGQSESLPKDGQNPSIQQTSGINPNLVLDSSDDDEFTDELLCSASGESSQQPSVPAKPPKTILSCYICQKKFLNNRDLLIHWQTHKSSSKSCNVCGKSFVNMVLLNKHSAVHFRKDATTPFICKSCNCTFVTKQDFITHMLFFKHGENRIFKCDDCGGFFMNESDLKTHLETHEDKHKTLRCEECGENFQKRLDLRNHMVNHIGERNYKCDECNLTFKSKFVLSKHQEVMHSGKLVCSICNLSFGKKEKKNYDFHVKLHSK